MRVLPQISALSLGTIVAVSGCGHLPATPDTSASTAQPTTLVFKVEGMHCNGCVEAITAEIREVEGVSAVSVSLENHSARVEVVNPSRAVPVQSAITSLGYKVTGEVQLVQPSAK